MKYLNDYKNMKYISEVNSIEDLKHTILYFKNNTEDFIKVQALFHNTKIKCLLIMNDIHCYLYMINFGPSYAFDDNFMIVSNVLVYITNKLKRGGDK